MDNSQNEIFFNFSYYALNLLGKQMYTNKWSAISELVANGLDAGASEIYVDINSKDKMKSTIEILDNGSGMNYNDLEKKYALIGRNKRDDSEILSPEFNKTNKIKGRKGIGKLAALFLTKKYYILTKKNGVESAWILNSTNVSDSEIPKLTRVPIDSISINNNKIWTNFENGTLIKLIDVNLSYFGLEKLEGLKNSLADYFLLDNLNTDIFVSYQDSLKTIKEFEKIKKEVAFKNFYAFFESPSSHKKQHLNKKIRMKSIVDEIGTIPRDVLVISDYVNKTQVNKFRINGESEFISTDGKKITLPYNLEGWIGIHSTIKVSEAKQNDSKFIRNTAYNPNRLKLYIRDKLAVENYLDYLKNNQAFANYIEGEISFDILDDDRLPDIATTNREGLAKDDERILLLSELLRPIVGKLISERTNISRKISEEEKQYFELKEIAAQKERDEARLRAEEEFQARKKIEKENEIIIHEKSELQNQNKKLADENTIKNILLTESNPESQELLTHELTIIRNAINYSIEDITIDFSRTNEYSRVSKYLAELKRSADKLTSIKNQFLRLNNHDIIGKQNIDIKSFVKSYCDNIMMRDIRVEHKIGNNPLFVNVDVFELGVILDNIIVNILEQDEKYVKIEFVDEEKMLRIISETGPIQINPPEDIFNLGVTSKTNGTGIGMYLVKTICTENNWNISIKSESKTVTIEIVMEDNK